MIRGAFRAEKRSEDICLEEFLDLSGYKTTKIRLNNNLKSWFSGSLDLEWYKADYQGVVQFASSFIPF